MDRNYLKGQDGDRIDAVLAAGFNFHLSLEIAGSPFARLSPGRNPIGSQRASIPQKGFFRGYYLMRLARVVLILSERRPFVRKTRRMTSVR
jgi:hypothetical protein